MSADKSSTDNQFEILGAHLGRDPVWWISVALGLSLGLVYLLPLLTEAQLDLLDEYVGLPAFLGLVLLAFNFFPRPRGQRAERRFWLFLSLAYSAWLTAQLLGFALPPLSETFSRDVALDSAHLVAYLFMVLATETGPHHAPGWRASRPARRLGLAGTVVFLFGVLAYCVVIPGGLGVATRSGLQASYSMFMLLDLYLLVRWAALGREARAPRYKAIFGLLALTAALWLGTDLLELLNHTEVVNIPRTSPLSLLWYLPVLTAIAAARLRPGSPAEAIRVSQAPGPMLTAASSGSLVAYAFLLPAAHFLFYATGIAASATRSAREVLLLIQLLILGSLAVAQQRVLARRRRALEELLRRARTELSRTQRLDAVGRLAGGVAHDFNNVLTVVRGSSELLRASIAERPEHVALLDTLDKATDHAAALTKHLLAVARHQTLRTRTVSPDDVVSDTGNILAGILGPDVSLRTRFACAASQVRVDPAQLERVLVNLASNARDAMPHGGRLTIETRDVRLTSEDCSKLPGLSPGEFVALHVGDNGTGMDAETLEHVFEPFFTTKGRDKGSGLGLATVYGIVRQSGGGILVDSRVGTGTTFTIYLPRVLALRPVDPAPIAVAAGSSTDLHGNGESAGFGAAASTAVENKAQHRPDLESTAPRGKRKRAIAGR